MDLPVSDFRTRLYKKSTIAVNAWMVWIFVFSVFSKELGNVWIMGIDFDMIGYTYCIFHFLYFSKNFNINRVVIFILVWALLASIISKFFLGFGLGGLWKQFFPIMLIYLVNYDMFYKVDFVKLFKVYFHIAYLASIFGFIQLFAKLFLGIRLLTQYNRIWIDSIAYEPSHFVVLMMPAAIYAIINFKEHKLKSIIISAAVFCTFSSTALICYAIFIPLIFRKFKYVFISLPVLYVFVQNVLLESESFMFRFDSISNYLKYGTFDKVLAGTSISFLTNIEVAVSSIKRSPLIGVGLGGHEEQYFHYFRGNAFESHYLFGLNAPSAHNLLIRIISEHGLIGLVFFVVTLSKSLLLKASGYNRAISIACFSHFVCKSLKLGGYFDYGTPFFVMMLLFNYSDYKYSKK